MMTPVKRIVLAVPLLAALMIGFAWWGPASQTISNKLVEFGLAVPAVEAPNAKYLTGTAPGVAYTFGPILAWVGVYCVLIGIIAVGCFMTKHPELDFPMTETERAQFAAMSTAPAPQPQPQMMEQGPMGPDLSRMTPAQIAAATGQVPNHIPGLTPGTL